MYVYVYICIYRFRSVEPYALITYTSCEGCEPRRAEIQMYLRVCCAASTARVGYRLIDSDNDNDCKQLTKRDQKQRKRKGLKM